MLELPEQTKTMPSGQRRVAVFLFVKGGYQAWQRRGGKKKKSGVKKAFATELKGNSS